MKRPNIRSARRLTILLAVASLAAMVQSKAHAAGVPVARWNLGEQDSVAVAGNPGNATTADAIDSPANDLTQYGSPAYSATVPAGGSTLSMSFSGGTYYRSDTLGAFTNGTFDINNFSIQWDCYPTANNGYSAPVSIGLYNAASFFFFMKDNGQWSYNFNSVSGSQPDLGAWALNTWQHLEFRRVKGTNSYWLNGVQVGPTTDTFAPGGANPLQALTIGGIGRASGGNFDAPGGDFVGLVDNVVVTNFNLGAPPEIASFSASPGKIYTGNSIILNGAVSGDPAGRTFILRKNGIVLASTASLPYKINGVTTNHNGNYDMVATNNYGAATSSIVAVSVLPSGGADVLKFRMGDNDPGAVAGNTGNAQTIDAIFGNNLDISGNPTYSSTVPADGGSISMTFDGASYYRNVNLASFVSTLDQANYSISFDAYCTALGGGGFSFPMSFGKNGGGLCIVEIGGTWNMYRLGIDTVPLAPVQLNTWTHFEIQRRDFDTAPRIRVFMNGVDMDYQRTGYNAPSGILTAGGNTIGDGVGTEGLFNGLVDNIVIHNYSIGALPSITSFTSSPGTTIATNQPLTLTTVMSGGTPATYIYKRNGTTVATQVTNNNSAVTLPAPVTPGSYTVVVSNSPAGVVTSSTLAITVDPRSESQLGASYNLGEQDPGAVSGGAGNALTLQANGIKDLAKVGGVTYTNLVPAGGSTLSAFFDGAYNGTTGSHYGADASTTGVWASFFANRFNNNNFVLSCDAYPTGDGAQGFSVPISIGTQGQNYFIYHAGGSWNVHKNGSGNIILGPGVTLNQWVNLKLVRKDFGAGLETHFFVDGTDVGSTTVALGTPGPAFTVGGNARGNLTTEGPFLGAVDNVVLQSFGPSLDGSLSGGVFTGNITSGLSTATYRLERTSSLSPASWSTVDTQTTDVNGAATFTDPAPPAGQAFYRALTP